MIGLIRLTPTAPLVKVGSGRTGTDTPAPGFVVQMAAAFIPSTPMLIAELEAAGKMHHRLVKL